MRRLFGLLLLLMGIVFSSQSLATMNIVDYGQQYDVSYVVTDYGRYGYDTSSDFRQRHLTSLNEKAQKWLFLAFVSDFLVTKSGIQANRAQGKAGEAITETTLRQNGSFAGKQVTFETSTGQRSVIDFVTNSKGGKGIVETKTGNARLTSGQRQLFDDVQNGRPVIPRGGNASKAGLEPGVPTVLKKCGIDRPC